MALKDLTLVQPGERTSRDGRAVTNRILLAIPDAEFHSIRPPWNISTLRRHYILHEPNERPQFLYFQNGGMVSLVVVTEDGRTVEAGIVGKGGNCGSGSGGRAWRGIRFARSCKSPGTDSKLRSAVLQEAMKSTPKFQMMLSRYAVLHGLQVSQTAACNRLHDSEQRLARWLLMTQDRVDSGLLQITHDFLATMLGTDRPSITLAAGQLQKKTAD